MTACSGGSPGHPGGSPGLTRAKPGHPGAHPGHPGGSPGTPEASPGHPGGNPGTPEASPGGSPGLTGGSPGHPRGNPGHPGGCLHTAFIAFLVHCMFDWPAIGSLYFSRCSVAWARDKGCMVQGFNAGSRWSTV